MSLFPTLQKVTPNATQLFSCYPALWTKNAPTQFQAGSTVPPISSYYDTATPPGPVPAGADVVCWQRYTGGDPVTGYAYPSGVPLSAYAGGVQEGFGMYVISHDHGMGFTEDQAAIDSAVGISNISTTIRGVPITALRATQYNHLDNGYKSGVQSHFMIFRQSSAADLSEVCFDVYMRIPDQSALLDQTYRFRTIHAFKTTNDFRYEIYVIVANSTDASAFGVPAGTLGIMVSGDNYAGNLTGAEFFRLKKYASGDFAVPTGWFRARIYFKRSASYDDLTTGRFRYSILDFDTGVETDVFNVNPETIAQYNIDHPLACTNQAVPSNCVNRHMGVTSNKMSRLFLASNYHGGLSGKDVQFDLAKIDGWDGWPA